MICFDNILIFIINGDRTISRGRPIILPCIFEHRSRVRPVTPSLPVPSLIDRNSLPLFFPFPFRTPQLASTATASATDCLLHSSNGSTSCFPECGVSTPVSLLVGIARVRCRGSRWSANWGGCLCTIRSEMWIDIWYTSLNAVDNVTNSLRNFSCRIYTLIIGRSFGGRIFLIS